MYLHKVRKLTIILLLLAVTTSVTAQGNDDEKKLPSQSFSFGLYAHTFGSGVEMQSIRLRQSRGLVISVGFGSYKLAKEHKIESLYKDQGGEDYYFDKKNYTYSLQMLAGVSKEVFERGNFSKIGLRLSASAGPVLAFQKPYYIEVAVPVPGSSTATVKVDKYDGSLYAYSDIVGEADFFLGMNQITVVPGMRARVTGMLDFSASREYIRAVELGIYSDYFFTDLAVFDQRQNPSFRIGGSIALLVGNAW